MPGVSNTDLNFGTSTEVIFGDGLHAIRYEMDNGTLTIQNYEPMWGAVSTRPAFDVHVPALNFPGRTDYFTCCGVWVDAPDQLVPEPGTAALFCIAFVGLAVVRRMRG